MSIASPRKTHFASNDVHIAELFLILGVDLQELQTSSKTLYERKLKQRILGSYPTDITPSQFPYIANIPMVHTLSDML